MRSVVDKSIWMGQLYVYDVECFVRREISRRKTNVLGRWVLGKRERVEKVRAKNLITVRFRFGLDGGINEMEKRDTHLWVYAVYIYIWSLTVNFEN